jgi:hypothetical protein
LKIRNLDVAVLVLAARGKNFQPYIFRSDVPWIVKTGLFVENSDLAEQRLGIRIGIGLGLLEGEFLGRNRPPFACLGETGGQKHGDTADDKEPFTHTLNKWGLFQKILP